MSIKVGKKWIEKQVRQAGTKGTERRAGMVESTTEVMIRNGEMTQREHRRIFLNTAFFLKDSQTCQQKGITPYVGMPWEYRELLHLFCWKFQQFSVQFITLSSTQCISITLQQVQHVRRSPCDFMVKINQFCITSCLIKIKSVIVSFVVIVFHESITA